MNQNTKATPTPAGGQGGAAPLLPPSFYCPITHDVMADPVMLAETGQTFERAAILSWLQANQRCPLTNVQLQQSPPLIVPNFAMRSTIEEIQRSVKAAVDAPDVGAPGNPNEGTRGGGKSSRSHGAADDPTDATDDVDWTPTPTDLARPSPTWTTVGSHKSPSLNTDSECKGDDGEGSEAVRQLSPSVVLADSYRRKGAIRKATEGRDRGKWEMTVEVPAQSVKGFDTLPGKILGVGCAFVNKIKRNHGLQIFQGAWKTTTPRLLANGKRVDVHEVRVVAEASMTKREARTALDAAYKWISDQVRACDQDYRERQKQQAVLAATAEAESARDVREVEVDVCTGIGIRVVPPHRLPRDHRGHSVPSGMYRLCKLGVDCHHGQNCYFATNNKELKRWNRMLCDDNSRTASIRRMPVQMVTSASFTGEFLLCRNAAIEMEGLHVS